MLLFDVIPRTDPTPAKHLEAHYHFLNRVATPFWGEIRRVLEEWFIHLPAGDRSDLRARFRSSDDRQHTGAFWELYLHELFIRLGFVVHLHPTLPNATTMPDMLVERNSDSFYVEAVALTDTEEERQSARRRGQVYDSINERVQSPAFYLDVEAVTEGHSTPPLAALSRDLDEWLASLDPDAVPPYDPARPDWILPTHDAVYGDWVFRFRAFPKGADRRVAEGPTVGMFGPPNPVCVNDHDDLMDRLRRKSRKYGETDRPLVIALLYERWTADANHLTQALFGWGWGHPEMFEARRIDPTLPNESDGLWLTRCGPRHCNGSAILCAFHLAPHSIAKTELSLWHHPWARHVITTSLPFTATHVDPMLGEVREITAMAQSYELFGLPSAWPPGKPFPR